MSILMFHCLNRHKFRAFTLIELLVVIAIIGVLIALLLPAVQAAREAARRAQCVNNLKQLALAAQNYVDGNGCLPGGSYTWVPVPGSNAGIENFSVFVRLLPYLEQSPVYNAVNFALTYKHADNVTLAGVGISTLMCPSDPWKSVAIYAPFYNALPPGGWIQQFSSYAGVEGTFSARYLNVPQYTGEQDDINGVIFGDSTVRLA